ncbi:MAG TPA: mycothiol system anti-sigma-R factor [Acidimicrobiales bacterium]|nr:mycothiol system anti-sigma-R factor [Acidimicrobiales bacterium]
MGSGDSGADCDETIERLYHYLDGELTDERRAEIKHHLDDCSPCLDAYGFEEELRHVIANRCRDHVPESLLARIRQAIEDEERRVR